MFDGLIQTIRHYPNGSAAPIQTVQDDPDASIWTVERQTDHRPKIMITPTDWAQLGNLSTSFLFDAQSGINVPLINFHFVASAVARQGEPTGEHWCSLRLST